MIVEIDILGKDSDSLLVEEKVEKKEPSKPEKLEGFTVWDLPQTQLEIVPINQGCV